MDFHINKGATLPILKMELIKDGRYSFKEFHDKLQNSDIFFTMYDLDSGNKVIGKKKAKCLIKTEYTGCTEEEYYLVYKFNKRETSKSGTFVGKFIIEFKDVNDCLIVPIRQELYIHVLDGHIKR